MAKFDNLTSAATVRAFINSQTQSRVDLQAQSIPAQIKALRSTGYAAEGDGGGARYKRVAAQPAHEGKFRSADRFLPNGTSDSSNGGWWEIDEAEADPRAFGAKGDATTNDTTAIQNAIAYAASRSAVSTGSSSYYRTPATVVLRNGIFLASQLKVFGVNVAIRGENAILRAADPSKYVLLYAPWQGGWQGNYVIHGLTFDGLLPDYISATYGRDATTAAGLTVIAENADLNIIGALENIGLIVGSNNVEVRNCNFTRLGLGLFWYTGLASIFGETGNCFAYSGATKNCGFRSCLYDYLAMATDGTYAGNLTLFDCYHSATIKACCVLKETQQILIQKQTADTRGIPVVAINSTAAKDQFSRFETNSTTIGQNINMADLLAGETVIPYRMPDTNRISHYARSAELVISGSYTGNRPYAVSGSRLDVERMGAPDDTALFYCDASSYVKGETFTSLVGQRFSWFYDGAINRPLPIDKLPSIKPVSGKSNVSVLAKSFRSTPIVGIRNYFTDDPFLAYDLPRTGGSGMTFEVVDDGVIVPKCLEAQNQAASGWSLSGLPSVANLTALGGYVVTSVCLKRTSADPCLISGPYGLARMLLDEQNVWKQFISVLPISEGIPASLNFSVVGGAPTSTYRICNFAVVVVPSWMAAKAYFESNHFPVMTYDLAGAVERRRALGGQAGRINWAAQTTAKYATPNSLVGQTAVRQLATPNEYVRAIYLKATGAGIQNVKVGNGLTDTFYAASVTLPAGVWVKVAADVALDTAGTAAQNGAVRITPLASATMDVDYKIEFGKLL